jgi:LPS export ABC transporter protein LptC
MKMNKDIIGQISVVRLVMHFGFLYAVSAACSNDIETINALTNMIKLPDVSGYDIEISYTDSGILKGKIIAPEANDFNVEEEPYTEFPKGIKVVFYDLSGNPESYIQANYAILYKKKQLWEGRGQVVAENPGKGEKLETEQIFWDQKDQRIYSEKYSVITNQDGIFYGENGFEAREDLTKWWMRGYKGKVNVREDLSDEGQDQ